ncbi:3167_t:CDS:2, partial [Dentiscutata erythropus]
HALLDAPGGLILLNWTTVKGTSCRLLRVEPDSSSFEGTSLIKVSGIGLSVSSVIAFGSISMFCGSPPLVFAIEALDVFILSGKVSVITFSEVLLIWGLFGLNAEF